MNIQAITPNYVQNSRSNYSQNQQKVGFTGAIGDKYVQKLVSGVDVRPDELVKEMKGTFGIKTDKAEDIMESLIGKVKELLNVNSAQANKIESQEDAINILNCELDKHIIRVHEESAAFDDLLRSHKKTMAAKDNELNAMKEQLTKYESVAKVKPISEIGVVMPEAAIKIMDEMIEHNPKALDSMHTFLMTGKGQEEALAQIERNNVLAKAYDEGMFMIGEVENKGAELRQEGVTWCSSPLFYAQRLMEQVLQTSPKADYLRSHAIASQVKDNAMAILTPLTDNKYSNTTVKAISSKMDETIKDAGDNARLFRRGMEMIKKYNGDCKFEVIEEVPYDWNKSLIRMTNDKGLDATFTFNDIVGAGRA